MFEKYKLFCDESCHMENDSSNIMVLGSLFCPETHLEGIIRGIKALRHKHNYHNELKWTKLISKQFPFYKELIDLFFQSDSLRFKVTVVLNK